jgi:hypothetical protein
MMLMLLPYLAAELTAQPGNKLMHAVQTVVVRVVAGFHAAT